MDTYGYREKADRTEVCLVDESEGPGGLSDDDCRFSANGPSNGSLRKRQSLTVNSNETAE